MFITQYYMQWLVECLTSHITHYRSYRRWSSQSITWQVLAKLNQTTINTVNNSKNLNNLIQTYTQTKPNKTKTWFKCLLHHPARKRSGSILQLPDPHGAITCDEIYVSGTVILACFMHTFYVYSFTLVLKYWNQSATAATDIHKVYY